MNILNNGSFYIQKDDGSYEKIFDGEIETIEFEPEPLDITNELNHAFWNIKPMSMTCTTKLEPNVDSIYFVKPADYSELSQINKIQKRKHHKTRISKKWAKKYGYYTFKDVYEIKSLKPQDIDKERLTYDCEVEFKERRVYWD